jgi:hypothetical protein
VFCTPALPNRTRLEVVKLREEAASCLEAEREQHRKQLQQLQQEITAGEGLWQRFEDVVQQLAAAEAKLEAVEKELAASAAGHRWEVEVLEQHVRELELCALEATSSRATEIRAFESQFDELHCEMDEAAAQIRQLAAENLARRHDHGQPHTIRSSLPTVRHRYV